MTIAVCPGSYDPVTAGHLDVIERSARFFDEVHVVVAVNAAKVGATVIIKGLRQNGDYEAELGMALVNRKLAGIETLFLPADPILEHISSSIVKDVARHGGDVTGMVPDCVVPMLADALAEERQRKD